MKQQKILFISNIAASKVGTFSIASIMASKKLGLEFHMAANFKNSPIEQRKIDEKKYGIKIHQIDFIRNPLRLGNVKAYRQLAKLVRMEQFDIIHCNTPIGGVIGRLIGKKYKIPMVIYQAHGFHFYQGAPLINWLIYYPIEKWLAHYTNILITINSEDFKRANKFCLKKTGEVCYVPGVGVNINEFSATDSQNLKLREDLHIPKDAVVLISVGELNKNKNNITVISAVGMLKNPSIHYIICGEGSELSQLRDRAKKLQISQNVHFLGYRKDIKELYATSDIFVLPSVREGLSRSLMEAMACGLPCVASKVRGNVDLIEDGVGGYLCNPADTDGFTLAIKKLANDQSLRRHLGENNLEIIKKFDIGIVEKKMMQIYREVLREESREKHESTTFAGK